MSKPNLIKFVSILLLVLSNVSCAKEQCVFENSSLSEEIFSSNPAIQTYQLFSETDQVKGVLTNGHLFSAKYWHCTHSGKEILMVIAPNMEGLPATLNEQVLFLAKAFLDKTELASVIKKLENEDITLQTLPVLIPVEEFGVDEFYIQVEASTNVILVEIKRVQS